MKIPKQGESGEVTVTFSSAVQRAAGHVVAAEALDVQLRHASDHPEDSAKWLEAKRAAERFPRELGLANAWAQIAQALK